MRIHSYDWTTLTTPSSLVCFLDHQHTFITMRSETCFLSIIDSFSHYHLVHEIVLCIIHIHFQSFFSSFLNISIVSVLKHHLEWVLWTCFSLIIEVSSCNSYSYPSDLTLLHATFIFPERKRKKGGRKKLFVWLMVLVLHYWLDLSVVFL